ncbi:hypothetical protein EJ08DRAFT_698659 [Tothia fuscella]|uniref:Lysine-specific metallo-endopeptidase domain-containing protein n=1 Tax=Tothia fuscella TaxID=1048955 RepID=A0A9P4NPL3_9PEZI|nr:hypothetical protein EJ08DRAFT_698659 [Tothia fuscella]
MLFPTPYRSISMLFLLLPILALAVDNGDPLTYWIDDTCKATGPNGFNESFERTLKDVIHNASRALKRLQFRQDANQNRLLSKIFEIDQSNVDFKKQIEDTFSSLSRMVETQNRASSDVRFYCDEDVVGDGHRWTLVPDDPEDSLPNSKRKRGINQEVEDKLNHMKMAVVHRDPPLEDIATQGVQDGVTRAELFYLHNSDPAPPEENPTRSTVTLGSENFGNAWTDNALSAVSDAEIVARDKPYIFKAMATGLSSFIMMHELLHHDYNRQPRTNDYQVDESWDGLFGLTLDQRRTHPDSYVWFAVCAVLADRQYRFDDAYDLFIKDTSIIVVP